ncbi:hypothetical protein JQ038_05260 [Clostridium botulinum]|nr:hypothetical protein [Clostridium botulinum]
MCGFKKLSGYSATSKILISCRMSSYNSNYLNSKFEIKKITISKLKQDYIDKYFQVKNNKEKNKKLKGIKNSSSLLVDIDDIFSIALLWDVVENIDETTTKVELIEMKIKNIIEGFDESKFLSPKQDYYLDINKDIAYIMQKICN